jgi:hypothetical protein
MEPIKSGFFRYIFFLFLFSTLSTLSFSMMREAPKSFTVCCKALKDVRRVEPPKEESNRDAFNIEPKPFIFALAKHVNWNIFKEGTCDKLADGSKLWRLRILSRNAASLNLGITDFLLPAGAKLWIYNFKANYIEGPYENKDNTAGQLWTPIIPGEEIVVEVHIPAHRIGEKHRVCISKVNHGKQNLGQRGPCNIDVVCPETAKWHDQIRSVAFFTLDGTKKCSGVLLNNTQRDFTPYFLTADHCCVKSCNAHTMVIYWNYQSPNCSKCRCKCDNLPGSLMHNQTGAVFRAKWTRKGGSDFALVELKERPDPHYNVYYSGWDATGNKPKKAIGIHHPHMHEKSISFSGSSINSTDSDSTASKNEGYYWHVQKWLRGTIQDGSSGSGLWDAATDLCVGQLWGGSRGCDKNDPCKANEGGSWYGKLSAAWEGGGTPETQLKYWLDPCRTGTKKLPGADPLYNHK